MSQVCIPVLMYHAIQPNPSVISISASKFEWQMKWLHEQNFRVLPLSEVVRLLREKKTFPPKTVSITFDDAFKGVFEQVLPVLQKYGYPATVFVVSGYCGLENNWPGQAAQIPRLPLAGWEHIQKMDRAGIEIGSHTISHPRLDRLEESGAKREIIQSKNEIEARLGHSIDLFAFPYGYFNHDILAYVADAYNGAVTTRLEMTGPGTSPYEIGRVDIYYMQQPALFKLFANQRLAQIYLFIRQKAHSATSRLLKRAWA